MTFTGAFLVAITLEGGRLALRFDKATGALLMVVDKRTGLRVAGSLGPQVDVKVDGAWVFSRAEGQMAGGRALGLDGEWEFRTEGGRWRKIRVPGAWEDQGVTQVTPDAPNPAWKPYNGTAYYRRRFRVPKAWKGRALVLRMGPVDDEDWVYINGRLVGHTGMDAPNWWAKKRVYRIPPEIVNFGDENEISVKVYDRGGEGGILGSVVLAPEGVEVEPNALRLEGFERREGALVLRLSAPGWRVRLMYSTVEGGVKVRGRFEFVGEGRPKVEGVRFSIYNVRVEPIDKCLYTVPGVWPPRFVKFTELRPGRSMGVSIWGATPAGIVHNSRRSLGLVAGFYTETEPFSVEVRERKDSVDVRHTVAVLCRVRRGDSFEVGDQYLLPTEGDVWAALRGAAKVYKLGGFELAKRPKWAYGTSIYSLFAQGSIDSGCRDLGGFENFRKLLLPQLHRMGIGVVWFNPCWPGGYAPTDYFALAPQAGTEADLERLCQEAHRRGMRVFLDLIPHGPRKGAPVTERILKEHPDWVSRWEDGSVIYKWGCIACDYAHPGWQRYMARVATYWMRKCGVDGYRVDVAGGGPPNWRPYDGLRPSQSGIYGGLRLLEVVRGEMRRLDPDSALLGEVGSPLFLKVCDFIYDWPFSFTVLRSFLTTPRAEWVRNGLLWLEIQKLTLPDGACFGMMRMLENHDVFKSVRFYGVGPMKALLALCALAQGVPFVFNEQEAGFERFIGRLLTLRRKLPEIARGEAFYLVARSSDPEVMAFVRKFGEDLTVVAINFASERRRAKISLPLDEIGAKPAKYSLFEAFEGRELGEVEARGTLDVSLDIPPFEPRVVAVRPAGKVLSLARPPVSERLSVRSKVAVEVERIGPREVAARNGHYEMLLKDGLVERLVPRGASEPLVEGMALTEGERKLWLGRRLDISRAKDVKVEVERKGDAVEVLFEARVSRLPDGRGFVWRARYRCDSSPNVKVDISLVPEFPTPPVLASLLLEIRAGMAGKWQVETVEGRTDGLFGPRRAVRREFRGWRYWHPSGRLWESAVHPLNPATPAIWWERGGRSVLLRFLPSEGRPLPWNCFARDFDSEGKVGLTFFVSFLPEREPVRLEEGRRLGVSFVLSVDKPLPPVGGREWHCGSVSVKFDGPIWTFSNGRISATLCRSRGGALLSLADGEGKGVGLRADIYTDYGFYPPVIDPMGREVKQSGHSWLDFEPDVFFEPAEGGLKVRFRSYLRSSWRGGVSVAGPPLGYELTYEFGRGDGIGVRCGVRPPVLARGLKAFLALVFHVPEAAAWRALTVNGLRGGKAGEKFGRVWESEREPLAEDGFVEVETEGGLTLRFSSVRWEGERPQNVFVHVSPDGGASVFFAFLDGKPTEVRPEWRFLSFKLSATEAGR